MDFHLNGYIHNCSQCLPVFLHQLNNNPTEWNHRKIKVGRDVWRSFGPTYQIQTLGLIAPQLCEKNVLLFYSLPGLTAIARVLDCFFQYSQATVITLEILLNVD